MQKNKSKTDGMLPNSAIVGLALQLGFAVSTTAVLFVWGGHSLDERFGTSPWLLSLGVILGLGASLYLVWQIVRPLREQAAAGKAELKK